MSLEGHLNLRLEVNGRMRGQRGHGRNRLTMAVQRLV